MGGVDGFELEVKEGSPKRDREEMGLGSCFERWSRTLGSVWQTEDDMVAMKRVTPSFKKVSSFSLEPLRELRTDCEYMQRFW